MNRIDFKFQQLRRGGSKAAIAYLTVGFPDLETSLNLARGLARRGADIIELGVPFSDPVADGPTIQAASDRALKGGVSLPKVFDFARRLRKKTDIPLLLMGYLNPFFSLPPERLAKTAKEAGVDGLIVPDLPLEESQLLRDPLAKAGLDLILLLAPTSSPSRIRRAAALGSGFIYYVSRAGVTGARKDLQEGLTKKVGEIRRVCRLPICVGFGVSTPDHVRKINRIADGVIVGSALMAPFFNHPPAQALCLSLKRWEEIFRKKA